ncbi:uncharacterized protein LOC126598935 isoform X3 [Malus sylvestris]|uniref:uncharacterized protein LOC126598935 isoform X3 n=1 Tax=Malus sylvestris TaxID=3752 RepID=UPI0021AC2DEC|nr:uncharacterized protein LOC126598935 isoform X3 [Malus sylvestris]
MVRLRLTGGTKTETTSRGEETGDQVDLIDLQAETKKYKIGDQTDGFAKVSIQSLHEENMKLIQLVSETKNANVVANTEILLKLLEDRTKCVENLVELEKIREASKALVKEDDRDVKEKPGIQKRDVKRKRPAEKKLQKKDGREEACSSRPALQPCGDEIVRAREEAYKKILPCPRCDSRNTTFDKFSRNNPSKPVHACKDYKRSWVARGNLGRG